MLATQNIIEPVTIPLWIDLLAVFIAGLSGSLIAIRKRFDPAGVLVVTMVSALGGGLIRDVLIGRGPPAALLEPAYLYVAFGAAGCGFLAGRRVQSFGTSLLIIDAASLGLYTFVGMQKGLLSDLPVITAALLGVTTAIGGGLLRDLLSGEAPEVLRPGQLTMSAAIAGVVAYSVIHALGFPGTIDLAVVVAVVMGLRLASEWFGWRTPEATELPQTITAMGGTILSAPRRIVRIDRDGAATRTRHRVRRRPEAEGRGGDGPPGDEPLA